MNRREVFEVAWRDNDAFFLIVSVPHGAVLPEDLTGDIKLDFGRAFPIPMNSALTPDALTVELSFNRTPFLCEIPWGSVRAIVTPDWVVSWTLRELPTKATGLTLVK